MIRIEGQTKDFSLFENLLEELLSFFRLEPNFFIITSDMLIKYSKITELSPELFEMSKDEYLKDYPTVKKHDYESFFEKVETIYQMTESDFSDFRGDFTEYIITRTGPNHHDFENARCLNDVYIRDGQHYIGNVNQLESGKNFDVCFYEEKEFNIQQHVQCELYECKINLRTFIPLHRLHWKGNTKNVEKVKFMELIRQNFSHNPNFTVGFVTLTRNLKQEKRALSKLSCDNLSILTRRDIFKLLS